MTWITLLWLNRKYIGWAALVCLGFAMGCSIRGRWDDLWGGPKPKSMGWINDPERVQAVLAKLPKPLFRDAANGLIEGTPEKDSLLYLAGLDRWGPLSPHDQDGTGCCVGEGLSGGVECLQRVLIVAKNEPIEYKTISAAASYALAREVGGLLGQGDGAIVADAIEAVTKYGAVSSEAAKDDNTTGTPHARLAKQWGRTGLPKSLKDLAKAHTVKTASQVRSAEEVRVALINGYPVVFGSNVGFEGRGGFRRDARGFCYPGGTWPHCMYAAGYRKDSRAFCIIQSWGPDSPSGPVTFGQPSQSFWIEWSAMERICRTGEAFALSAFDGFPAQDLPFFVHHKPVEGRQWLARSLLFVSSSSLRN